VLINDILTITISTRNAQKDTMSEDDFPAAPDEDPTAESEKRRGRRALDRMDPDEVAIEPKDDQGMLEKGAQTT
jgi:hypothetical protein